MSSKHINRFSLEEAQAELLATITLSKRFEGYKIHANLLSGVEEAAKAVESGDEKTAVQILMDVIHGIRATLVGFFRKSPEFFRNTLRNASISFREIGGLDQDIRERVEKTLVASEKLAKSQLNIDLEKAAVAYGEA